LSARRAPNAFDAVTGMATTLSRPFASANPLLRPFFEANGWRPPQNPVYEARNVAPPPPPSAPVMEPEYEADYAPEPPAPRRRTSPPKEVSAERSDIDSLRAELAELKTALLGAVKPVKAPKPRAVAKVSARAAKKK